MSSLVMEGRMEDRQWRGSPDKDIMDDGEWKGCPTLGNTKQVILDAEGGSLVETKESEEDWMHGGLQQTNLQADG